MRFFFCQTTSLCINKDRISYCLFHLSVYNLMGFVDLHRFSWKLHVTFSGLVGMITRFKFLCFLCIESMTLIILSLWHWLYEYLRAWDNGDWSLQFQNLHVIIDFFPKKKHLKYVTNYSIMYPLRNIFIGKNANRCLLLARKMRLLKVRRFLYSLYLFLPIFNDLDPIRKVPKFFLGYLDEHRL